MSSNENYSQQSETNQNEYDNNNNNDNNTTSYQDYSHSAQDAQNNENSQDFTQNNDSQGNFSQNDDANSRQTSQTQPMEPEQFRKVFIGGLSYKTDEETFKSYFSKYGELVDYVVMKDKETNKSRGFGFVTYASSSMVDELMKNRPHIIDGRQVEPKRATPREDSGKQEVQMTVKKLFIGGIRDNINEEDLKQYFGNYGNIVEAVIMRDKEKNTTRGFGFISFDDYDPIDKIILEKHHTINGVNLHVQKALPKDGQGQGGQGQRGGHHHGGFRNQQQNQPNFNMGQGGGFNQGAPGAGGFTNFQKPFKQNNPPGQFGGMQSGGRGQGGFGNSSMNNTYGSYNQAPKMNENPMMNQNRRGGGGPIRGGQGRFGNRSAGPYGGGNMNNFGGNRGGHRGRGVGHRGGAGGNQMQNN